MIWSLLIRWILLMNKVNYFDISGIERIIDDRFVGDIQQYKCCFADGHMQWFEVPDGTASVLAYQKCRSRIGCIQLQPGVFCF